MFQAITVQFVPATDRRPSRWKAEADGGKVFVEYDYGKNSSDNARAAAMSLASKLGWPIVGWTGGGLPKGGYVFVRSEVSE